MFKDYKEIFKNLRETQEKLWQDSMAHFPGAAMQSDMREWQQKTLGSVNTMVEQAIGQSLELQQQWLDQWSERIGGKKLKPKLFAELSAEARNSAQQWLNNQNRLWEQWLQFIRDSGSAAVPDFAEWEKIVQESIERQKALLGDWSEIADFRKLSTKEMTELSSQITKSMQKSIETQQQFWKHWFDEPGMVAGTGEPAAAAPAPKKPRKKAAAKKTATKKVSAAKDSA